MQTKNATGAINPGSTAMRALAVGAFALGAVAIGRLRVLEARIEKLSMGTRSRPSERALPISPCSPAACDSSGEDHQALLTVKEETGDGSAVIVP